MIDCFPGCTNQTERDILKVIKFLKNLWKIISNTEFVFSQRKNFQYRSQSGHTHLEVPQVADAIVNVRKGI